MLTATVYAIGVLIGLMAVDGGPGSRVGLALVWPLGPLAFVVTVLGLLVVAAIAFPLFGVALSGGLAAGWWLLQ